MAHLRWCSCGAPRKQSGWDQGDDTLRYMAHLGECTHQAPGCLSCSDLGRAQNACPTHTDTHTELCLSVSCGGMGQKWPATGAGTLGAADLGHTVCA